MSCSELDDLLDEILGDQIFRSNNNNNNNDNVPSHKSTTRQRNGQPTCNAVQRDNAGTANNGTENHDTKYHDDDVTKTRTTSNTESYPAVVVGGSVENCAEFQTRGRTPSLPGNYSPANRYRRLQSVPCNDYYGGTHRDTGGTQSYYERSDQFVHGLCTDEPIAWLDRQKLKLQSRYENRWRSNQSDQQRRLVEELKAAQTMLGFEKQTTQADDEGNDGARSSSFQKSQTLGHQRQHGSAATGGGVPVQMSDQLQGLDLLLPCASDAIRNDAMRSDAIRSDAVRSDVIRSDAVRSDAIRSDAIRSDVIRNDAMRSDAMRSDAIRSDAIRNDAMRSDVIRSDAIRSDVIRSDVIRSDAIRSDAIRSDAARSDAIRNDAMRSDVIRSDVIRSDAVRSDAVRSDAARSDAVRSDVIRSDAASCKSERNYYISGVEMPPFTTHQTKYVFSVSSPHSSSSSSSSSVRLNPSDVIQKVQQHDPPQVNARPGPPTPKRVSSRDALRHSYVHDWKLEQWEQGSYTSLSSKSDVPETSAAADKRNEAADTRQRTSNSSGCAEDQSRIYDALDVSKTRFNGINNPATSYRDLQGCVEGSTGSMAANGTGKMVQISGLNGSSTSGTSSLSINSASQSAFEPLQQCSGDGQQGKNYATSFCADSANPFSPSNPDPVSASRKTSSHPTTDLLLQHSVSDFALGRDGFSRNSQNLTENSSSIYRVQEKKPHSRLPSNSSSFPPDVPFPAAVSASATKSQPNISTMTLLEKSLSLKKCEDSHDQAMNSAAIRHLPVSPEQQPPGNDVMEVISLQLIGPGMQKLEPEGDLPAVRPVTPKCPQPGIGVGASNSLKSRPKSLGNQRHASSGDNPHPGSAVHQKFDPGPRRATIYDHTLVAVDFGKEQDICNREQRAELADALNGEDQTKQRVKHRRHTTASGHDLLLLLRPGAQQHRRPGGSSDGDTAFRRTERLLSADFTAAAPQGQRSLLLDRRGSASPPSTEPGDGTDDVFGTAKSSGTGRRGSRASGQREREVNLAMLDNAVAGLRASASSPVDGSSSSNTVVQLPPPGKATPGLNPGRDPLSPRASIHTLSNGAVTSSSSNNSTDTTIRTNHAPRFVRDSSRHWHKPNISRDEAIGSLKDMAPGTFLIRNSNSFPGAFGLALKVAHLPPNVHSRGGDPKAELVRHFLIEPTSKGVKLKGCNSEPVFGSLAALVYQHSLTALSLPCKLIIPDPSSARKRDDTNSAKSDVTTSEALLLGATCNVLYINSVDMESLTGNEAIDKAVSATFATTPTPLTTVVQLKVSSQGVTLTDVNRKLFFRRHYPVDTVTFAGIDPEMRSWVWTNDETKSAHKSSVFGFVARKQGSPMDNACHVFAELDRDQPGDAIVDFIMKVMLGQG